ncbi:MAG: family 10 glycosylhydrolase [Verrucomicrobia bacterium]|nr:family 10 glycosylhydrolase [Verrucomicrobiota bacterium]
MHPAIRLPRLLRRHLAVGGIVWAAAVGRVPAADGFSTSQTPTVTAARVEGMGCRYYTELLGVTTPSTLARQFGPLAGTDVDTVVCCASGWRFYNFPSKVDLTWREPDKFPRDAAAYPAWRKMVANLQAGGDPLREALAATRALKKRFIVSFRMNDNHYVHQEEFPTHNNFWRAHPAWRLGDDPKPYALSDTARVLNYLIPEVRDFYFAVLEEICTGYDVDGVELDFQRAPRFFHDRDLAEGRAVMTAHVRRIREMLDRVGAARHQHLRLGIRTLHTVGATAAIGADVLAWKAAGWIDDLVVSSSYIQTADVGLEGFVAAPGRARVFGELNFVHLQLAGMGHNADERRYVTAPTYRAATLSFLERGADGVSFFNTYCIPPRELEELRSELLVRCKDPARLLPADKDYTTYPTANTMFGKIFPARDETTFQVFVADALPGGFQRAALRFETRVASAGRHIEAWVNGVALEPARPGETELFPPMAKNATAPKADHVVFFTVPVGALKFGVNTLRVKNADAPRAQCDFTSAELGLYRAK